MRCPPDNFHHQPFNPQPNSFNTAQSQTNTLLNNTNKVNLNLNMCNHVKSNAILVDSVQTHTKPELVNEVASSQRCVESGCNTWAVAGSRYCASRKTFPLAYMLQSASTAPRSPTNSITDKKQALDEHLSTQEDSYEVQDLVAHLAAHYEGQFLQFFLCKSRCLSSAGEVFNGQGR